MLRMLICGLAMLAVGSSVLVAKPGIVKTRDGKLFEGDITDTPGTPAVNVTGVAGSVAPVGVNRDNILEIIYPEDVANDVHTALKKIDAKDVKTRITMAKMAIDKHAYTAARDALDEAAALEPTNKEVSDLMVALKKLLPAPATLPTTKPVPATNPVANTEKPKLPPGIFIVKRMVNTAEINRIRQLEWLTDDSKPITVRFDGDVRKRYQQSQSDLKPAQFNALKASEIASLILKNRDDLSGSVIIMQDPVTVRDFKQVRSIITRGCAAANCHGGTKAGTFTLQMATSEPALYTDFLTLQKYAPQVKGVERPLIDRTYPESSLLLEYMLAPEAAEAPHPETPNLKRDMARSKKDAGYQKVLAWIKGLDPKSPSYNMNLSVVPPQPGK